MTMLAERLKDAGADTIGAQLTAAVTEGIRHHADSAVDAWRYAGAVFGHEFTSKLMRDMQGKGPKKEQKSPPTPLQKENYYIAGAQKTFTPAASRPYQPRVISKEKIEKHRKLVQLVSKYMNSGDVPWSKVTPHEAIALQRDSSEGSALLDACPQPLRNDGKNFGEILGIPRVDEIVGAVRKTAKARA